LECIGQIRWSSSQAGVPAKKVIQLIKKHENDATY
jgi:hypothetical protein